MEQQKMESIPIATRITGHMQKAIEKVLLADGHLNQSDYLRDLIRKDLEHRGLLEVSKNERKPTS